MSSDQDAAAAVLGDFVGFGEDPTPQAADLGAAVLEMKRQEPAPQQPRTQLADYSDDELLFELRRRLSEGTTT